MRIAIDFDGTIVEHKYPEIGKELLFAFETMKELQKQNHLLILWTYRTGKQLDEAIEFCRKNGVEFYAINRNYPEEQWDGNASRKIQADVYIDDLNLGGFPGWSVVWQMLNPIDEDTEKQVRQLTKRREFFRRLFRVKKPGNQS
jgi:hypothetical protein